MMTSVLFLLCNENLRIFIAQEEDCRLLKISRFSGRNPDGRCDFFFARAAKESKRAVHAAALDDKAAAFADDKRTPVDDDKRPFSLRYFCL